MNAIFWKDKRVFLTGHTGFKGGWLGLWLSGLGAKVTGYSLEPIAEPNLYNQASIEQKLSSVIGDIRDPDRLSGAMQNADPEIIFHLAAQPLVRESYSDPVDTFTTNINGTINVLEIAKQCKSLKSMVIVTSDKCYLNRETIWPYKETDCMGGDDPYSASKGCAEIITASYFNSYFKKLDISVTSGRAGNVIGGGDWSHDRLIPDLLRARANNCNLELRNPDAVRPWQHVLEPLHGYILLAENGYKKGASFSGGWNFGPGQDSILTVLDLIKKYETVNGDRLSYSVVPSLLHEAKLLSLDSTKSRIKLGWRPVLTIEEALKMIFEWNHAFKDGADLKEITKNQLQYYIEKINN